MKKTVWLMILLQAVLTAYSLEILVPPLHIIDERFGEADKSNTANTDLTWFLEQAGTAPFLTFQSVGNGTLQAPQSLGDALRIGQNSKKDYLLYGFVARKEFSWSIELKMLDVNKKELIGFFYASDDADHFDRMLHDVSAKVIGFMDTYLSLGLADKKIDSDFMSLAIPVQLGYWTPVERKVGDVLTGTGKLSAGLEFVPKHRVFLYNRKNWYFSLSSIIGYKYGFGNPDAYPINLHGLSISFPAKLYCQLNERNLAFFGFGPVYAIDITRIKKKYDNPDLHISHTMGTVFLAGYRYHFSERTDFFVETAVQTLYYSPKLISFEPALGIIRQVYTKETR